jgi:hypothetical protein
MQMVKSPLGRSGPEIYMGARKRLVSNKWIDGLGVRCLKSRSIARWVNLSTSITLPYVKVQ